MSYSEQLVNTDIPVKIFSKEQENFGSILDCEEDEQSKCPQMEL